LQKNLDETFPKINQVFNKKYLQNQKNYIKKTKKKVICLIAYNHRKNLKQMFNNEQQPASSLITCKGNKSFSRIEKKIIEYNKVDSNKQRKN
jgi:hypothetical protein